MKIILLFLTTAQLLIGLSNGGIYGISWYTLGTYNEEEWRQIVGCEHRLPMGQFIEGNMAACPGNWTGHIKDSNLCATGWHVCSSQDASIFAQNKHSLKNINGCYTTNAAHDNEVCSECQEGENKTVIEEGRHCSRFTFFHHMYSPCMQSPNSTSNFRGRLLPLSKVSCRQQPWINGVICCRNEPRGDPPVIVNKGEQTHLVPLGGSIKLTCKAYGQKQPTIRWLRNGGEVDMVKSQAHEESVVNHKRVTSTLILLNVTAYNDASYVCKAYNLDGITIDNYNKIIAWNQNSTVRGCKNGHRQIALPRGNIFACEGSWKGHVRKATKSLCAKGYKVCSPFDDGIAYFSIFNLRKKNLLPGCYAYNGGWSKENSCSRCSSKLKGNRMAGIGSNCGAYHTHSKSCGYSYNGRIDVWPGSKLAISQPLSPYSDSILNASKRQRKSCNYKAGLTTGVLCCRKSRI